MKKSHYCAANIQNDAMTGRIFLSIFGVVFMLGCVSIMPSSVQQEEEPAAIEPSPVLPTVQPSPIPPTQNSECTRLNLTAQECTNLGKHLFTLSGVVDGFCWYGENDRTVTRDFFITVSFSESGLGMTATIEEGVFIDCPTVSRSAENTYTYDCIAHGNHETGIITFIDQGFLNVGRSTNSVNKDCSWSEAYELK